MQFIDDEFIIVIDEPYTTYHLVFDLDQDLLVVHNVSQHGRIKSPDIITYKPPSSCRKRKLNQLYDDTLTLYRKVFN
jgi:hypothetical protein